VPDLEQSIALIEPGYRVNPGGSAVGGEHIYRYTDTYVRGCARAARLSQC